MIRRQQGKRGAAAMEFALTFPLILFLAIGIIEFGWCFHMSNQLHTAVRDAARQGALTAGGSSSTGGSNAESQLNDLLTTFYDHCAGNSCTISSTSDPDGVADSFLLDVQVPYSSLTGIAFPGLPSSLNADIVFAIQP
jgi:Flp pilus assembly protein TadG